ncbi:MAG TPA: protein kinase [Dongiaceae bacterium]|nr:protein kinase [Dongiaceae bacterium]
MSLKAGEKIGPYEVLGPLGAGAMGEVWRARDARIDREVAIKMLPASFAANPERLRRFEQEARAVGRLNHPNILTLFDLGTHAGTPYLVCERLEGESLRARLGRGALPPEVAREFALQTARGLAAAHAQGVVHRDLKPENLFVTTDGRIKILDFGLAKVAEVVSAPGGGPDAAAGGAVSAPSQAPTALAPTGEGVVLGTVGYMAPEQVRGVPADARADLFAFGVILHEMLEGQPPFRRATAAETMTAILREKPGSISTSVPAGLRDLVRACLAKSPADRPASAAALVERLEALRPREAAAPSPWSQGWRRGVLWGARLLAVAGAVALFWRRPPPVEPASAVRLTQVTLSEATEESPAFSPDGRRILYTVENGGLRQVHLRELDSGADRALTSGPYDALQPTFTPDGAAVLYVRARRAGTRIEPGDVFGRLDGGDVYEHEIASGRERRLLENAFAPAVSPDGTRLAVDAAWVGPSRIWVTDRQGQNKTQVTSDASEAVTHLRPRWSPDGKWIVFEQLEGTRFDIRLVDVATRAAVAITDDLFQDLHPVFTPSGRAVLFSSYRSGGLNLWRIPVGTDGRPSGRPEQLTTGAGQDLEPTPAPDGHRIAFAVLQQNAEIWSLPVDPGTGRATGPPGQVVSSTREDSRGAWSPDGREVAFNSDRSGTMNVWIDEVASGSVRALTHGPGGDYQPNWSPDGRSLVFFSARAGTADIWRADVATGALKPLTSGRAMEINPFYSPDGARIAYQSDETGRLELWVMNADGSSPHALTTIGVTGHFVRFTPDGKEIVFKTPSEGGRMMAIPVDGGEPRALAQVAGGSHSSFSPDGSRLIDVVEHKTLWVSPLKGGAPEKVFAFEDPSIRIDYPVWSPDGKAVLFDKFQPRGGDVWLLEGADVAR